MSEQTSRVRYEKIEDVAVLTLNDPEKLNPISDEMRAGILAGLEDAMSDNTVRAVVLTGAGGNFTSGADIRQLGLGGPADPFRSRRRLAPLHRTIELIAGGPKPVIGAVEGAAFGAGLSFAVACDFLIISETARFGAAFGKIGLTADSGLMWSLPQRVGRTLARDLMFTARPIKADEALAIGLADHKVEAGGALAAALAKASEYRVVAPLVIAAMKSAFVAGPSSLADVLALERQQQPMMSMSEDHAEGIAAFREKRAAKFLGR
jgi:enoyl-CoA hydratase/carnithine racemase